MAALKAIKITDKNQKGLASLWNVDDYEGLIEPGYWLVTEFGNEETFYMISNEDIKTKYTTVRPLLNNYIEIRKNA